MYFFKVLSLLLIFHTTLFAIDTDNKASMHMYSSDVSDDIKIEDKRVLNKPIEIVMNCFGGVSISIMLLLTSLLGAFFIRDEFVGLV